MGRAGAGTITPSFVKPLVSLDLQVNVFFPLLYDLKLFGELVRLGNQNILLL